MASLRIDRLIGSQRQNRRNYDDSNAPKGTNFFNDSRHKQTSMIGAAIVDERNLKKVSQTA